MFNGNTEPSQQLDFPMAPEQSDLFFGALATYWGIVYKAPLK
jgi:hypothetical protein